MSERRTRPGMRFRVVGRFTVERDGVAIAEADFGSRKARLLLKLLAARQGRLVAMDDIIDVLWAGEAPAKAEANVATLVSRLRAALGPDVINGGRHGYRLSFGPAVSLDIAEAERLIDEAEQRASSKQPALALTAATRGIDIISTGAVLEDEPGAEWAIGLSRELDRLARRAHAAAWRAQMDLGDHRAALNHAQAAIDLDALDEEAHRVVILCYHRLGEQGEALRAYERLRVTLVEELGANPGPETEALFAAVLRGDPVAKDEAATPVITGAADDDFVGRDGEVATLLAVWSRAIAGASACVLISGEAGIGKTRLAAEVADEVRRTGATVLRARCYEAERSLFLQPIIEVIREAMATVTPDLIRRAAGDRARSLTALVPELAAVLGTDVSVEALSELERRRTFEAVAQALAGLARIRPVLVVVDDLHEAGASTLELLHFTLRWDPHAPLMVVATARRDEADEVHEHLASVATSIELSGLTAESIQQLADRAGVSSRAEQVALMTRGHTLFVVEAVRALVEAVEPDEGSRQIRLPPSLREAVTERARRLGPAVDELLRAAVVVGSTFDVGVLAEVLGMSPEAVIHRAESARRAGILVEAGDGYEFANDLIREILYDTTPKPLRVVRHRRLATLLVEQPEAAAVHAAAAGDTRAAVTHWQRAADRAAAAFANHEADQLLSLAVDAAESLHDERLEAVLLLERGKVRLTLGRYGDAAADLLKAEGLAHALGATDIETAALTERAWGAYHARDVVAAEELAERAAAMPEAGPRVSILVGRVRNGRGNLEGSITLLRSVADDATEERDRAYALSCLGSALAHSDRYQEALPVLDQAVVECRRTGILRGLLNARMFGAIVLANIGRFGAALSWAEQLVVDAERFDAAYYHPRALNSLAMVWRELGDSHRANDLAEEALATSTMSNGELESEPAANALLGLAEAALASGDEATVAGRLDEIAPLLSDRVAFAWRIELRRLEIQARLDPARTEELLVLASQFGSAKYQAIALSYLGRQDEAVATATKTGSSWLVARVGPEPLARQHVERLAAGLQGDLRTSFIERGPLLRRFGEP